MRLAIYLYIHVLQNISISCLHMSWFGRMRPRNIENSILNTHSDFWRPGYPSHTLSILMRLTTDLHGTSIYIALKATCWQKSWFGSRRPKNNRKKSILDTPLILAPWLPFSSSFNLIETCHKLLNIYISV